MFYNPKAAIGVATPLTKGVEPFKILLRFGFDNISFYRFSSASMLYHNYGIGTDSPASSFRGLGLVRVLKNKRLIPVFGFVRRPGCMLLLIAM